MSLRIGEKSKIFEGKFLSVWATEFLDTQGKKRVWEWIERKNAVFIFPITREQNVVLIKNFRIPLEQYVIEMPAGLMDHEGENEEALASRELQEETGYIAETFTPVHPWPYRSGISNGVSKGFIATGLRKVSGAVGDATEDIHVFEIPMDELLEFYLRCAEDTLFDVGILALHHLAQHFHIRG